MKWCKYFEGKKCCELISNSYIFYKRYGFYGIVYFDGLEKYKISILNDFILQIYFIVCFIYIYVITSDKNFQLLYEKFIYK